LYEKYKDDYGFANWWLGDQSNYDAPAGDRHSWWESKYFARGAVLDANFFHYSPAVRRKIIDIFRFMYTHGLQRSPLGWVRRNLLGLSEKLSQVSPVLERAVFAPVVLAERLARKKWAASL
jgi:hypothetical protein